MDATVASAWQMPKNIRRKRSRRGVAAWKQVAVLCLLAGSSGWTDGSLTSTEAPDADEDLRIRRSELTCANGECGGADVLKVVSQLAKRLLSDPRILSLNSGTSGADQSGRSSRINSRPFTSGSYYKTRPSAADRQRIADLFSAASDSGSFRQKESRYIDDYDSADKNSIQAANSVAANDFFTNYFVTADVSDVNDVSSSSKNDDDVTRDSYDEGDSYSAGDTYSGGHGGHAGHGGDSYGGDHGGDSYGGGHGGDSYGGGCCNEKDQYLPILVVGSLGLLAFYLYLRTTNGGGRRRRRRFADDEHVPDGITNAATFILIFFSNVQI